MDNNLIKKGSLLAISGVALTLGLAWKSYSNKVATKEESSKTIKPDSFESHICDHDGNGLVPLCPTTLWHVTAQFKGNGPPWRRMIVYRPVGTNSLILLAPVAVPEDVMSEIDKLGNVEVIIIPNSYHRTDSAVFKQRYPNAKVACPPGWTRKKVAEIVATDMDAREVAEKYKGFVKVVRIGGLCDPADTEGDFEYGYEFHVADGSWAYAVTDTLFNCQEKNVFTWALGTRGIVHSDGAMTPRVGRLSKCFMYSRSECAAYYRAMAQRDDISMILMAHGDVLVGERVRDALVEIADDVDPK